MVYGGGALWDLCDKSIRLDDQYSSALHIEIAWLPHWEDLTRRDECRCPGAKEAPCHQQPLTWYHQAWYHQDIALHMSSYVYKNMGVMELGRALTFYREKLYDSRIRAWVKIRPKWNYVMQLIIHARSSDTFCLWNRPMCVKIEIRAFQVNHEMSSFNKT